MKRWTGRLGRLGLGFSLSMATFGCAQERDPIDRVQANALKKDFFVGQDLQNPADDPEFYKRDTVVDVGYGAGQEGLFTATYAQPVSRIRWEITETALNARLSYERIKGSDTKGNQFDGNKPKLTNDGQIVASYKIESHFDIRRAYNPSTGEEQNVYEENTTDRQWNEREYFRVDWSKNMVTDSYDFDTLSMMGIIGGISYDPIAYTVNDPNLPDAPHFEQNDKDGHYFDITNKVFATPKMLDLSSLGWGIDKYPACMLPGEFGGGTAPLGNCNPQEVTLRSSYKQVIDHDYEPKDDDGYRFQAAGAFETDYRSYERDYGMLDSGWHRFISRYNLWERSHYYADPTAMTGAVACATYDTTEKPTGDPTSDPNRDLDNDGTADECKAVTEATGIKGSKCDIFTKKCTLPYEARKSVAIPWYVAGDVNDDYFEASEWGAQEWDVALKAAIQTAKLVECRKGGGKNCDSKFPMWTGQQEDNEEAVRISRDLNICRRANGWDNADCNAKAQAAADEVAKERGGDAASKAIGAVVSLPTTITLCHNPVQAGDHPACGEVGKVVRLGDIRYNIVNHIEKPQDPSAWGIMVDADDPLTGEKVAASINIWTHVTDIAAQGLVDLVRYSNGELKTSDITDGKYITNWAAASKLNNATTGPTMSKEEVGSRIAGASGLDTKTFANTIANKPMPSQLAGVVREGKARVADAAVDGSMVSQSATAYNTALKQLRGTDIETQLMNPAMLQMAGVSGTTALDGTMADMASPLALNSSRFRSQLTKMRENGLAAHGACILQEAPEATSVPGLADALKAKFPGKDGETGAQAQTRYQAMIRYVKRMYHYAVLAHEMGHSVGLRHNFVSTSGPLHYRPQYWQLRTKNGAVTDVCTTASADGESCVGPRYYDPVTTDERDNIIQMFMQSTVMDYPGDVSQDMIGLGAYDFHAARMFYSDVTTVYQSDDFKATTPNGLGITDTTDNFGGLAGIKYSVGTTGADGKTSTQTFHYSELQNRYGQISNCYEVTPKAPAWYDPKKDGIWHQVLDGHMVPVDGVTKKCRQQPVDYVAWNDLHFPQQADGEVSNAFYRGGPNIENGTGRTRVPYHFASDNWADTGNVSVFRHDNGADPYEQMQFLISVSENRHIFDNYRRGRSTFNVRAAADRYYSRYNEKILGVASGMAFISNIYQDLGTNQGYASDAFIPFIMNSNYQDNILAGTLAFDHFSKILSRPQAGPHYISGGDGVLRSTDDTDDFGPQSDADTVVVVPNGSTGFLSQDVSYGGRPLNNAFAEDKGDYDTEYTISAGNYYGKASVMELLSLSEDRYVSSSRRDFYDARFRANGMPDLFPEGYRRLLANSLTNDRSMLAPHLQLAPVDAGQKSCFLALQNNTDNGVDLNDPNNTKYPGKPLVWTSWWPKGGPKVCTPLNGTTSCLGPDGSALEMLPKSDDPTAPTTPTLSNDSLVALDPQVGWEVQKFLIVHSLAGVRDTAITAWSDMMAIYKAGPESAPDIDNRIEWADPESGQLYYAATIGKECLFDTSPTCANGKMVQKGIGARVLEYANQLTVAGYQLDTKNNPKTAKHPAGYNDYGRPMVAHNPDGSAIVVPDLTNFYQYGIPNADTHGFTPCTSKFDDAKCTEMAVLQDASGQFGFFLSNSNDSPFSLCSVADAGTAKSYQVDQTVGVVFPPSSPGSFCASADPYVCDLTPGSPKQGLPKCKAKDGTLAEGFTQVFTQDDTTGLPITCADGADGCATLTCTAASTLSHAQPACDQNATPGCTQVAVAKSRAAMELKKYKSVPEFLRQVGMRMGRFESAHSIGTY